MIKPVVELQDFVECVAIANELRPERLYRNRRNRGDELVIVGQPLFLEEDGQRTAGVVVERRPVNVHRGAEVAVGEAGFRVGFHEVRVFEYLRVGIAGGERLGHAAFDRGFAEICLPQVAACVAEIPGVGRHHAPGVFGSGSRFSHRHSLE
jgi:hypothetical protein